jgi:hypothetical protein
MYITDMLQCVLCTKVRVNWDLGLASVGQVSDSTNYSAPQVCWQDPKDVAKLAKFKGRIFDSNN